MLEWYLPNSAIHAVLAQLDRVVGFEAVGRHWKLLELKSFKIENIAGQVFGR